MSTYFYDGQIRRFLVQFARMFSNFEVVGGLDSNNQPVLVRVPIRYGDATRQATTILADASANSMPSAPLMSFYIDGLKYDRPRMQEPYHVDRKNVKQRAWDEDTQTFEMVQGNAFDIERPMPVPYSLSLKLDAWTSSTDMKLQLLEQILVLFNPSFEIQSTDNYLDWTSLSVVDIDDTNWSSRSIPNNDGAIDIATLKFTLPIWISPPARVTKEGVIHKVIASIYDDVGQYVDAIDSDDILLGTRLKITPHGYQILLLGNQIRILDGNVPGDDGNIGLIPDPKADDLSWHAVIDEYGTLNSGISQIRLEAPDRPDVIGTISYHPSDSSLLLFNVDTDTLPTNTLDPVTAVINPIESGPLTGLATGDRYLLTDAIGDGVNPVFASAWGDVVANENDIIVYDGAGWSVAFSAQAHDVADPDGATPQYVSNLTTSVQFKYTIGAWTRSYEGVYSGGDWGLVI